MKKFCLCLGVLSIALVATECNNSQVNDFEIRDGLYVEVKGTSADSNFYTNDNQVYKANWEYLYDISIISPTGDSLVMKDSVASEDFLGDSRTTESFWRLIPKQEAESEVVSFLGIRVIPGNMPFTKMIPDYSQSIIELGYYDKGFSLLFDETTGLIENTKNIWLHPHRRKYFQILELNPFPYIILPAKVGLTWTWSLEIGDGWGDYRWKLWEGSITNHYSYRIESQEKVETKLGNFDCLKIVSQARSRIGETYLTAYYNEDFGFVRLAYTNIDKSQVSLNLTKIVKP
jgi:hypothetical protein